MLSRADSSKFGTTAYLYDKQCLSAWLCPLGTETVENQHLVHRLRHPPLTVVEIQVISDMLACSRHIYKHFLILTSIRLYLIQT